MDDDIFHLGIVNGTLGVAAPRFKRAGMIGIDADKIDR